MISFSNDPKNHCKWRNDRTFGEYKVFIICLDLNTSFPCINCVIVRVILRLISPYIHMLSSIVHTFIH
jgi:hypothetical protein